MIVGSNILAGASGQGGYFLNRSVRLRASASAYFNRTFSAAGNSNTWTFSTFLKRGNLNTQSNIFNTATPIGTNSALGQFFFDSNNKINFFQYTAGTTYTNIVTTAVFRDPSAWYHIVLRYDDTQATAANRVRIYVNGVQITAFDTASYPTQNFFSFFNAATPHVIGLYAGNTGGNFFDGYLTEINFVGGQSLDPSSFGEFNTLTGVWQPKKYVGTYGTNGFYLNFNDNSAATAAAIGKDNSGNGNNWTPTGISVTAGVTYDSMTDVPTLSNTTASNFCTWSPIAGTNISTYLSAGNLNFLDASNSGTWRTTFSTISLSTGKFYHEMQLPASLGSSAGNLYQFSRLSAVASNPPPNTGSINYGLYWNQFGQLSDSTQTISIGTVAANDVLMIAIDVGLGRLWVGKNGTWFSGNPATNTSPSVTWSPYEGAWSQSVFSNSAGGGGQTGSYTNFGQRPFSYTTPSGFFPINTYNLPAPTITNGATQMAATLWTGNGTSQSINNTVNGFSFQPDLVWLKSRSSASWSNFLQDTNRGITQFIISNSTAVAGTTSPNIVNAINSNGFSILANGNSNNNGDTYVGWQWKASNAAAVTNTSGTISSQVNANPTAGFSIITYTGTGTNGATFGHGLGVAPAFGIWKVTSGTIGNWVLYHQSLGATKGLNFTTGGATTSAVFFNNTAPTSTVWSLGTVTDVNRSTSTYVNYAFSEIAGYSKFGTYTGNGSTDGTFVYLGFRPRYIMFKRTDTTSNWEILDSSRNIYNSVDNGLQPNLINAETSPYSVDFLSNGFKARTTNTDINASGGTYIYAAFAENPFKLSLAR